MVRAIVCLIGTFVFGVIYGEILNGLNIFDLNVNVYLFAGSISSTFLFFDILFNYLEKGTPESDQDEIKLKYFKEYYYVFLALIGFALLVAVPFVWWGAIKTLALQAK